MSPRPARYDARVHCTWVSRLGLLHAPFGPSGAHELRGRRVDVLWPVGCYIGTDPDDRVRYVGMICRADEGFDARFAAHHQPVRTWDRVWLLPLRQGVPRHVVGAIEALLIWTLQPTDNIVWPRLTVVQIDSGVPRV